MATFTHTGTCSESLRILSSSAHATFIVSSYLSKAPIRRGSFLSLRIMTTIIFQFNTALRSLGVFGCSHGTDDDIQCAVSSVEIASDLAIVIEDLFLPSSVPRHEEIDRFI